MNRTLLLTGIAGLTLPVAGFAKDKKHIDKQPNIVIIYADDVGYGDLECYGGTVPTPNVNRLANSGVRFTNSHTTSATSTPSRFGLLTGVYPWRQQGTGIAAGNAGMIVSAERFTLADAAQSAGYKTGAIGKWHLGLGQTAQQNWNGEVTPNLSDIGFDYSYIMAATGDRVPCVFIENGRVDNWDETAPIEVSYTTPFEGEPTGKSNPEMLKLHPSHGHDMAIVNGISRIGYMKGGGKALWVDEQIADVVSSKVVKFIEQNKSNPFLLYFGTHDIHVPRTPHERFVGKTSMGARGDAILQFDYQIGQVLDALEKAGIAENTIVILSSDNGPVVDDGYKDRAVELLGNHKPTGEFRGGKYSAFEAGTRVPMLVRWPKVTKQNVVCDALFSHIDMLASLSELMGSEIPAQANVDSRMATEALLGIDTKGREYVMQQSIHSIISVLKGHWRFIPASNGPLLNRETNTELGSAKEDQLYNIATDKGERTNVASANGQIIAQIRAIMESEFAKGVEAKLPHINR